MPVEVLAVRALTPAMVRITVHGDGVRDFAVQGGDQWLRLFLPVAGQREPILPTTTAWWPEVCRLPEGTRPVVRSYSVRAARPELRELDLDIVLHGTGGPGSRWAASAAPGDRVGILDESTTYQPPAGTSWQLLLADESALPAVGSILEGLPASTPVIVYAEVPTPADVQDLSTSADLSLHWLPRGPGEPVGQRLLTALPPAALPPGTPYVWLAGEQRMVRQARRHLVSERGYPRSAVCFMSYWRRGRRAEEPAD